MPLRPATRLAAATLAAAALHAAPALASDADLRSGGRHPETWLLVAAGLAGAGIAAGGSAGAVKPDRVARP